MQYYQEIQFKIYVLFSLVDGEWKQENVSFLDILGKEMGIEKTTREETLKYGRERNAFWNKIGYWSVTKDHSKEVMEEIEKLTMGRLEWRKDLQIETVWNLINLAHADRECSAAEEKVIQYLTKKWDIENYIVNELKDTVDTIALLKRQKTWVKTTGLFYDEMKARLDTIDSQIQLMYSNVKTTIEQADNV